MGARACAGLRKRTAGALVEGEAFEKLDTGSNIRIAFLSQWAAIPSTDYQFQHLEALHLISVTLAGKTQSELLPSLYNVHWGLPYRSRAGPQSQSTPDMHCKQDQNFHVLDYDHRRGRTCNLLIMFIVVRRVAITPGGHINHFLQYLSLCDPTVILVRSEDRGGWI